MYIRNIWLVVCSFILFTVHNDCIFLKTIEQNAGVTHLNISLDTLQQHKFQLITRRRGSGQYIVKVLQLDTHPFWFSHLLRMTQYIIYVYNIGWDTVMRSIHSAVECGFDGLKINCVVIRGMNEEEVEDFVDLTRHMDVDVRFIEYMPFDGMDLVQNYPCI